jgi:hypothetical protein
MWFYQCGSHLGVEFPFKSSSSSIFTSALSILVSSIEQNITVYLLFHCTPFWPLLSVGIAVHDDFQHPDATPVVKVCTAVSNSVYITRLFPIPSNQLSSLMVSAITLIELAGDMLSANSHLFQHRFLSNHPLASRHNPLRGIPLPLIADYRTRPTS